VHMTNLKSVLFLFGAGVFLVATAPASGANDRCYDVDFDEFDVAPAMVDSVPPEYSESTAMSISGTIVVEVDVLEDGTVCSVRTIRGGHATISQAATQAARSSRFAPATRSGVPVPGRATIEYRFIKRDPHREPPELTKVSPMMSDIADSVLLHPKHGDLVPRIYYSEILIQGDLSKAVFDQIVGELDGELADDERIVSIEHLLVFPDSLRSKRTEFIDLIVTTQRGVGYEASGQGLYFVNEGGRYRLLGFREKWRV